MQHLSKVSIRHLLKHQRGIDGNYFPSMEYGDQSIETLLNRSSIPEMPQRLLNRV